MWIEKPTHYCDRPTPFSKTAGFETQVCPGCKKPNTFKLTPLPMPGQYQWKLVSPYIAWAVRLLRLDRS